MPMNWSLPATALLLVAGAARQSDAGSLQVYHQVTGEAALYKVLDGDTLGHIAGRFGMKVHLAATVNRLTDPHRLRLGQQLWLSNQRIVPTKLENGIVINVAERVLYWFADGRLVDSFPVGVGRADWETPPGRFTILSRRRKPTWHVPPTIQAEMRERGEPVRSKVPPGPDNPLGEYWLQLSAAGYGIHGTNAPTSVGRYTTHGCMRLRPEHIERLFHEAPNGTPVWVVYEPVKVAVTAGERVLIEAHQDVYQRAGAFLEGLQEKLTDVSPAGRIDLDKAHAVVADAWGVPVDVTVEGQTRLPATVSGGRAQLPPDGAAPRPASDLD
jgi:L,D-transpeptidase ErfK/SrfK